jgi:phosphopantetheinyl transferase (holo-ACP synthase)
MISTGNDIVALNAIKIARTKQPNFYKKIISATEKDLYDQQLSVKISFENFVWLLWSIKESVYKYLQRITPELVFSPTRVIISQLSLPANPTITTLRGRDFENDSIYKGTVSFGPHTLYSRSIINEEFIFSVVNHTDNFESVLWGVQLIDSSEPEDQSKAVRVFLMEMLKTLFPDTDLQIAKSSHGYPVILKDGAEIPVPVSLAHHGHYVAYSVQVKG